MVQTRLLETAIREFGAKGRDGASTRDIAAAAGTAMSSITYHFGGKDGLYLAAADHLARSMGELIADLPIDETIAAGDADRATDMLCEILCRMVDKVTRSDHEALFIVREQMNPTDAFDRMYESQMRRFWRQMTELVRIVIDRPADRECRIVALTLFGQATMVRTMRAGFERLVEAPVSDPELLAQIKSEIVANAKAILTSRREQAA